MKILKIGLKIISLSSSSIIMFICFVSYIPPERVNGLLYLVFAAGASISITMQIYTSLRTIHQLRNKITELEKIISDNRL